MSIATLKRKTQTKYNNMSVGTEGFSINGVFRNQGYVGQTSLTRSLPRTLQKGYGGCCGTYNDVPVVLSSVKTTEDSKTVKTSSMGTLGMLSSKYRWIRRPHPYSTVKPDSNNNTVDQSTYIENKKKDTVNDISKGNDPNNTDCTNVNNTPASSCVNRKNVCEQTRPASDYLPISSSEYTSLLNDDCQKNNVITTRPTDGRPVLGS
jgi:hypothetical protein